MVVIVFNYKKTVFDMSKDDELIKLQLQQKFKSPVGVRENEETLYANIAHEPLMLDNVRQIEVLQIHDAIQDNINYKRFKTDKIIIPTKIELYLVNVLHVFELNSDKKIGYNGGLYTQDEMINLFGFSLTESNVYQADKGVILSWFNKRINKYWDNTIKEWVDTPPDY